MTKLVDFTGFANGSSPEGALIHDGTAFYGTTRQGGATFDGTCFKFVSGGSSAGIEELNDASANVYPNPADESFTISTDNSIQFSDLIITSVDGKIVHSKSNVSNFETINSSNWTSEIYFVQLTNSTNSKTVKIEQF